MKAVRVSGRPFYISTYYTNIHARKPLETIRCDSHLALVRSLTVLTITQKRRSCGLLGGFYDTI
jgi:hypothetical protein